MTFHQWWDINQWQKPKNRKKKNDKLIFLGHIKVFWCKVQSWCLIKRGCNHTTKLTLCEKKNKTPWVFSCEKILKRWVQLVPCFHNNKQQIPFNLLLCYRHGELRDYIWLSEQRFYSKLFEFAINLSTTNILIALIKMC